MRIHAFVSAKINIVNAYKIQLHTYKFMDCIHNNKTLYYICIYI